MLPKDQADLGVLYNLYDSLHNEGYKNIVQGMIERKVHEIENRSPEDWARLEAMERGIQEVDRNEKVWSEKEYRNFLKEQENERSLENARRKMEKDRLDRLGLTDYNPGKHLEAHEGMGIDGESHQYYPNISNFDQVDEYSAIRQAQERMEFGTAKPDTKSMVDMHAQLHGLKELGGMLNADFSKNGNVKSVRKLREHLNSGNPDKSLNNEEKTYVNNLFDKTFAGITSNAALAQNMENTGMNIYRMINIDGKSLWDRCREKLAAEHKDPDRELTESFMKREAVTAFLDPKAKLDVAIPMQGEQLDSDGNRVYTAYHVGIQRSGDMFHKKLGFTEKIRAAFGRKYDMADDWQKIGRESVREAININNGRREGHENLYKDGFVERMNYARATLATERDPDILPYRPDQTQKRYEENYVWNYRRQNSNDGLSSKEIISKHEEELKSWQPGVSMSKPGLSAAANDGPRKISLDKLKETVTAKEYPQDEQKKEAAPRKQKEKTAEPMQKSALGGRRK